MPRRDSTPTIVPLKTSPEPENDTAVRQGNADKSESQDQPDESYESEEQDLPAPPKKRTLSRHTKNRIVRSSDQEELLALPTSEDANPGPSRKRSTQELDEDDDDDLAEFLVPDIRSILREVIDEIKKTDASRPLSELKDEVVKFLEVARRDVPKVKIVEELQESRKLFSTAVQNVFYQQNHLLNDRLPEDVGASWSNVISLLQGIDKRLAVGNQYLQELSTYGAEHTGLLQELVSLTRNKDETFGVTNQAKSPIATPKAHVDNRKANESLDRAFKKPRLDGVATSGSVGHFVTPKTNSPIVKAGPTPPGPLSPITPRAASLPGVVMAPGIVKTSPYLPTASTSRSVGSPSTQHPPVFTSARELPRVPDNDTMDDPFSVTTSGMSRQTSTTVLVSPAPRTGTEGGRAYSVAPGEQVNVAELIDGLEPSQWEAHGTLSSSPPHEA